MSLLTCQQFFYKGGHPISQDPTSLDHQPPPTCTLAPILRALPHCAIQPDSEEIPVSPGSSLPSLMPSTNDIDDRDQMPEGTALPVPHINLAARERERCLAASAQSPNQSPTQISMHIATSADLPSEEINKDDFEDLSDLIPITDDEDDSFSDNEISSDNDDDQGGCSPLSSDTDNDPAPPAAPAIPSNADSADSDSDSDYSFVKHSCPCPHPLASTMSAAATVEQNSCTEAPILHPSVYTINILNDFAKAFESFFLYKKVKAEDRIRLESARDEAPLIDWTWEFFLAQLKEKWLLDNWFVQVKKTRNASQGKRPWFEFQLTVHSANENLVGLVSYLDTDDMRLHLEEHMNDDLAEVYLKANHKEELANLKDIDKWIEEALLAENMTQTLGNAMSANKAARTTHAQTTASSNPDSSTTTSDTKPLSNPKGCPPHLTDVEKELLMKHLGCFVCHQFYTDHIGSSCKTGNPDPTTYKTLTEADALAAKAMYEAQKKTFIAGIRACQGESSTLSDDENMIGDSSDASAGNEYVDPSLEPFLMTPHLWMEGEISSPALSSAVPVWALIDHGSPTVLISAEFAIQLALKQCKLTRPIPFSSILDSSTAQTLDKCVCFRISKNSWTSHRIFAMICPTLHCDLILGTPFLYHNNVIIDHGSHSAFAAGSDINLLDSRRPLKTSMVPSMSPQEARLTAMEEHKHANKEILAIRKALRVTHAPLLHELESLFVSSGLHERMHPFTLECDLPCRC
ncbi:uncharacterized protein EV420DRAFT_1655812 [Desarmillaria tabescens]|uniref:Uncharacterized protein n=1 Tax=Armillaria tabescens TaxID=1929756 RepID=A0AA39IXH6_ARMTA|nr:uncharacterized protein EV420DRAFT_1655812 [Desarmillaria tabescens]KAK0432295.1 hypothetical protein EV420DRAFT_1655812 [Desarmillaria tabescens]